MREFWHQQTKEKPLFPDLLWSRPENKAHAGKLLIIGGNAHGFAAPAEAYSASMKAGIGIARVLLPDAIKAAAGQVLETVDYTASTPSGSFSKKSLSDALEHAAWADGVLFAGDLGRNSETAILVESFLQKYSGPTTLTHDAIEYVYSPAKFVAQRPQTTLVLSLAQLQKFAKAIGHTTAVTFAMDLLQLIDWLHEFTQKYEVSIVVRHLDIIFVAVRGTVSTTKLAEQTQIWRVNTAAKTGVWILQNPNNVFAAMNAAIVAN